MNCVINLSALLNVICGISSSHPKITISDGTLRGAILTNYNKDAFFAFKGIPYAKPPIGNLRFKAPVENEAWKDVLDATNYGSMCTQRNRTNISALIGSEDCLYLNVFSKSLDKDDLKPVMIYIHGGEFTKGSSSRLGPEFLMNEDIVLVTLNYRLGIYGFINFVDGHHDPEEMVANNGFRDQILAMKWVQKNIAHFGGDPNMVTLSGESVGGVCTHAHILSPLSKGLFHRAIVMSGTALMVIAPTLDNTALIVAQLLGIDSSDHNSMVNQLKRTSREDLFKAQLQMDWFDLTMDRATVTGLTIEKPGANSFISDYPLRIIRSGNYNKVPTFIGLTSEEGLIIHIMPHLRNDLNRHIPFFFSKREEVREIVRQHYDINEKSDLNNITMYTDIWFRYNMLRTALEHTQHDDNDEFYYYVFDADAKMNYFKQTIPSILHYAGAAHADDLGYLFKMEILPICLPDSPEERLMKLMVQIWTNFVKYGKPTDDWPTISTSAYHYGNITNDGVKFAKLSYANYNFWDNLYKTYSDGLY